VIDQVFPRQIRRGTNATEMLAENGGWALFIYTPRGRNHGSSLFSMAQANPDWFAQRLAVPDTNAITEAAVEAERAAGMPEDLIQQEFYCSFDATVHGSYFGRLMQAAETDGRITGVPYDPKAPVYTAWDLGIGDETAIWWTQAVGKEVRWIDYYESSGQGLDHYAQIVRGKP
jgi:phage terminase large subunit